MLGKAQIADDLGLQQADGIRRHGIAKARVELLRDGSPADDLTPLEDLDLEAGAREIAGAGQAVMPGTDDYCVVRLPLQADLMAALLHRNRLREVPRLVAVGAAREGGV